MKPARVKFPKPEGNKVERDFALHLASRLQAGEIQWFRFEPIRLRLGKGAMFTPDFGVVETSGEFTFYEVKGSFFREAAKVRLKVARELFPFFKFIVVRRTKDGWDYTDL